MSCCIAVADGVTVAAHWPSHSLVRYHPCSSEYEVARKCSRKCANAQETVFAKTLTQPFNLLMSNGHRRKNCCR